MTSRGAFIVIEGLDRAGKSTQVNNLVTSLNAVGKKFPERTTAIGKMIDSYLAQKSELDDKAIHLLFSANRWECARAIKADIAAGKHVVCDRYAFSGIAYSVAKGLPYDWCLSPDVGLPQPDLTIFLDLDPSTAAARGGYGEERYEKLEFQLKVKQVFSKVSAQMKRNGASWETIDAGRTIEEVGKDILEAANLAVQKARKGQALGSLFLATDQETR